MSDSANARLETEIGRVMAKTRRGGQEAAFRAAVEERLRSLESQVAEVKSRLNGLLFLIAGTVVVQALLRLIA